MTEAAAATKKYEKELDDARRKLRALEGEMAILSKFKATPKVEYDLKKLRRQQAEVLALISTLERKQVNIKVDVDRSRFDRLKQMFSGMGGKLFGTAITVGIVTLLGAAAAAIGPAITLMAALGAA